MKDTRTDQELLEDMASGVEDRGWGDPEQVAEAARLRDLAQRLTNTAHEIDRAVARNELTHGAANDIRNALGLPTK